MITLEKYNGEVKYTKLELNGISTDEKPIGTFEGYPLSNGSTFYEMDTKKPYIYDEENEKWWEV